MSNEFTDIILTIDSREKEPKRISSMQSFFEERGACVEKSAISINDGQLTSMDYAVEGSYNGKDVSLGISAKTLIDFSGTIGKLPNELARGYLRFADVGFILIAGCYETTLSSDGLHAVIRNLGATARNQDDRADVLNTTSMFNALESWQLSGIHCRQVIYEEQFPQAVMSILTYISKESHIGICFDTKQFSGALTKSKQELKSKLDFVNSHIHLGVDGLGVKTALKLRDYLISQNYPPNLHFATSLDEDALKDAIGQKVGHALYEVYRDRNGWIPFELQNHFNKITNNPLEYIKKSNEPTLKSTIIAKTDENPLKSNPEQFYKGELEYLNHNVYEYHEVTKEEIQKLKSLNAADEMTQEPDKIRTGSCSQSSGSLRSQALQSPSTSLDNIQSSSIQPSESHTDSSSSEITGLDAHDRSILKENTSLQSLSTEPKGIGQGEGKQISNTSELFGTPDTLQSLSAEIPAGNLPDAKASHAETTEPSTYDNLQSSEEVTTPSSADTVGESILNPLVTTSTPPTVKFHEIRHREKISTLEDAIIDRIYETPELDSVIIREFMNRGYLMPEIHEAIRDSQKIRKYKQSGNVMLSYCGVRADKELEVL